MAKVALYVNILALLPTLGGGILLGVLGSVFVVSHDGSDRSIGWLLLLVGIPLLCTGPALGLWLALSTQAPGRLTLSCTLGIAWVVLGIAAIFLLPGLLEAAVRP